MLRRLDHSFRLDAEKFHWTPQSLVQAFGVMNQIAICQSDSRSRK